MNHRPPNTIEEFACERIAEPESAEEVAEIVRRCEHDRITLAPIGSARTLGNIRSGPVAVGISMARMSQIVAYEPDDMTIVAQSGVTLAALNDRTRNHRQRLPLDPAAPESSTLGATIGASKAGPLRLSEGLVRDLLIGIQFVGHGGRVARAGGRVVKNVAGYDLMKVLAGSFGTLGIVTEAVFKVRPVPELYSLAIASYERMPEAFAAAVKLLDALPLAHAEIVSPEPGGAFGHGGKFLLFAGFSGNAPEIEDQRSRILAMVEVAEALEGEPAIDCYRQLRDLDFPSGTIAAQLAVLPSELARCLGECGGDFRAHPGCGVAQIWAVAKGATEVIAIAQRWREIAIRACGHLRVLHAPREVSQGLQFFDQPNAGAMKLMRRLKASFDPVGIFNPGCFVGGL